MAVMGSPASSACMFLGGSGILDKAVSCLRPWREVITGPTSIGLTGRLEGNFEVSGAMVPPRLQSAIPPHSANVPLSCSLSRPRTKSHPGSVSLDKLICMLVRLLALYQGLHPKYLSAALFIFASARYYCLLSDVSP